MRIGLISDTHIPWVCKTLPQEVTAAFRGVDLILHAGDIYSHSVLDDLERIAPVLAALGDDDYPSDDSRVKEKHVLQLEGQTLWLLHEGPPSPLARSWRPLWWQSRIHVGQGKDGKPDIIISGHEHRTNVERYDGLLCVNSGSATFLNYRDGLGTVGILELDPGKAEATIIKLSET
jgi:putative phosphoesterase